MNQRPTTAPATKVSFVTPTFNRAHVLAEAIDSIRAQTYHNWEHIIVDDGSTDNTRGIVEAYNDDRIRYVFQENKGQANARNTALDLVTGDWIAYLDSDNTLFPEYAEHMLNAIDGKTTVQFLFPKGYRYLELVKDGKVLVRIDQSSEFTDTITSRDIVHRNLHTDLNGFMHSRQVVEDGLRFDEVLKKMEDWDFLLMLCEQYPEGFLYVPEILYSYTQTFGGDGVVSNSTYHDWADVFEYIYQKHKHDRLMEGQDWYPRKVKQWQERARMYEEGKLPPYYLFYFKEFWPEKYRAFA